MRALFIVLAFAAQGPAIASETYRAEGWDPAWKLTIANGAVIYEALGEAPVSLGTPAASNENGETRYEAKGFTISILPIACTNQATGRRFANSVLITVPRDTRKKRRHAGPVLIGEDFRGGCGGAELPADSLNGTSWHFTEIAGERTELTGDLLRDDRYAIDFYADSFVGYTGCNRFSAGYSRTADILTTREPWGLGARACGETIMRLQGRLLEILTSPVRVSFPDPNTLVLTGEAGTIRLRRTLDEEYGLSSPGTRKRN